MSEQQATAGAAVLPETVECPDCGESVPVRIGSRAAEMEPGELAAALRDSAAEAHPEHEPILAGGGIADVIAWYMECFNALEARIAALEAMAARPEA